MRALVDPGAGGGINATAFDKPLPGAAVLAVRCHAATFQQKGLDALRVRVRRWVSGQK